MKRQDFLLLIVSSFILVVMWIVFHIYHNSVTSTIPETVNVQIEPINPSFDTTTIEKLKQRQIITPAYELSGVSTVSSSSAKIASPSATPLPTGSSQSSPSAQLVP